MAMPKAAELREMTAEELAHKRRDLTDELFNLRMRRSIKRLDNQLRLRMIGREIARINTVMRETELGIKVKSSSPKPTPPKPSKTRKK